MDTVKEQTQSINPGEKGAVKEKDKTTAVLLAVFLCFWTWCYTYKKDAWKFWLNLGLGVVTVGHWLIVAWIWAVIDAARRPKEFYSDFNQPVPGETPGTVQPMPEHGSISPNALSSSEMKRLKKWENMRKKGMTRFVLLYGVLFWGGLTGIVAMFFLGPIALLVFPIGGIFFGIFIWNIGESKYRKAMLPKGK
jgi:hypothetical protein